MGQSTPRQQRLAYIAWLLVCVFWSTTFLAIRIGVKTLPPLGMVSGARYLVAGLLLCAFVTLRGIPLPGRESSSAHALLGTLMLGVGNGALVWAEQWVPSGVAAVMVGAVPFWMIGVEAMLPSGERIRPVQFVGLLVGFAGLVLLASANLASTAASRRQTLFGAVAIQVSCCGWAIGSAYSKRHARHENSFAAAALQMTLGGIVLMIVGTILGEWHGLRLTPTGVGAWVYLIVFGAIVGYASYIYALKYLPVATVSLYAFVTPVLAVVLGATVLHEPLTTTMVLAIAIIFAGMLIVRRSAGTARS